MIGEFLYRFLEYFRQGFFRDLHLVGDSGIVVLEPGSLHWSASLCDDSGEITLLSIFNIINQIPSLFVKLNDCPDLKK